MRKDVEMPKTQGLINVIRGEDKIVNVSFRRSAGSPFDLTSATEIVATFIAKTGVSSLSLTGGTIAVTTPAAAGLLTMSLSSVFTRELAEGERQDFQIDITISSKKTVFRFEESINVLESLSV